MIQFTLNVVALLATTMAKNSVYSCKYLIGSTWTREHRPSAPIHCWKW